MSLVDDARKAFAGRTLVEVLHEDTVLLLGLTPGEVKVFAALLLADGDMERASGYAMLNGVGHNRFEPLLQSLVARQLIELSDGKVSFAPAETTLRGLRADEVAFTEGDEPSTKLVLQPLRVRVVALARQLENPAASLGLVYQLVFGAVPQGKEWALLGLIVKALGRDKAALLLLENATNPSPTLLHDLVGMAKARANGFRPEDAPDVVEQKRFAAALQRRAREIERQLSVK